MYIASVTAEEQAAFTPQLNHEHSEYKWWDVAALVNADTQPALHPVVDLLLQVQLLWPAQHTFITAYLHQGSAAFMASMSVAQLSLMAVCSITQGGFAPCPLPSGQGGPGQVLPARRHRPACSQPHLPPAHLQLHHKSIKRCAATTRLVAPKLLSHRPPNPTLCMPCRSP